MVGEYEWIAKYIFSYNLLGFCTSGSQPGKIYKTKVYKNHYDHLKEQDNPNYEFLEGNYEIYQRAFVNGWMEKDKALKFYEQMKNNPNYIVSLSCIDNVIDKEFEQCSLTAKDGRLMYEELGQIREELENIDWDDKLKLIETFKKIPNIHETCYGGHREKRPSFFSYLHEKHYPNMEKKYFEDDVIVCVSIMDKRWNNNDEFWTDILECLYKLK